MGLENLVVQRCSFCEGEINETIPGVMGTDGKKIICGKCVQTFAANLHKAPSGVVDMSRLINSNGY